MYTFPGTWQTIFDRMRTNLPNLADFQSFVEVGWHTAAAPNHVVYFLDTTQWTQRYTVFCSRYHPANYNLTPWSLAEELEGHMTFGNNNPQPVPVDDDYFTWPSEAELNRSEETGEGDVRALEELLRVVRARRQGAGVFWVPGEAGEYEAPEGGVFTYLTPSPPRVMIPYEDGMFS